MITIRKKTERGLTKLDWLTSYHSFSFDHYFDPAHHQFGPLRVLNDDIIEAGAGFGAHPHRDMEIVTYVLEGELEHRDSTGGNGVIGANEVQRMTAGTGIVHSEYNHSPEQRVRLLQIWFLPNRTGLTPGYEQKKFAKENRKNIMLLVASPTAEGESVHINQDVQMFISYIDQSKRITHSFNENRSGYLFVASGELAVGGFTIGAGDAAEITNEKTIEITATSELELVLFDLNK